MKVLIRLTLLCTLCLLISACATNPTRKVEGNRFLSEDPPLVIEFSYEIHVVEEHGPKKNIIFNTRDARPVMIDIERLTLTPRRVDYYYSLEAIASNHDIDYLSTKYFDDKKWAKITKVNENGYLLCGYMTRKGNWLILVFNYMRLGARDLERYEDYRRSSSSDYIVELINSMFEDLDKSTTIIK